MPGPLDSSICPATNRKFATTLLDKRSLPAAEFAALYNQRWRIEEWFKF
ncbi:MAG: transposase [Rhodocyclaceae bacterium]|nr:transposase [Rhodocyclaceae bacterium]